MDFFLSSLDSFLNYTKTGKRGNGVGASRQHRGVQEQEWQTLHSTFLKLIKFKQRKL